MIQYLPGTYARHWIIYLVQSTNKSSSKAKPKTLLIKIRNAVKAEKLSKILKSFCPKDNTLTHKGCKGPDCFKDTAKKLKQVAFPKELRASQKSSANSEIKHNLPRRIQGLP